MKITANQLRRIIKEEVQKVIKETYEEDFELPMDASYDDLEDLVMNSSAELSEDNNGELVISGDDLGLLFNSLRSRGAEMFRGKIHTNLTVDENGQLLPWSEDPGHAKYMRGR